MQGSHTTARTVGMPTSTYSGALPLKGSVGEGDGLGTSATHWDIAPSDPQPPASGLKPAGRPRRAFTLTELLVVIAIIGVLAGLITAAAVNALRNAKRARIVLEIKQMATAVENFKSDFGAYPPNAMSIGGTVPRASGPAMDIGSELQRMAKKMFPRINSQELAVFVAISGATPGASVTTGALPNGMSAAEAVYFWLGGFSADPQFPLSGPGGPSFTTDSGGVEVMENRARRYEFNLAQLAPREEDGLFHDTAAGGTGRFITYNVDLDSDGTMDNGERRRINLWRFTPSGFETPFVYFDCSRHKPYQYDMRAYDSSLPVFSGAPDIYPIMQLRSGAGSTAGSAKNLVFVNQSKFQILHPGLDDAWGPEFQRAGIYPYVTDADADDMVIFPDGPFTGEIADTLTNFTDGEIADEAEE